MKRVISVLLCLIILVGIIPVVSFASESIDISASNAFSWNFDTNAQNGTLPTSVSWGNYRACFMVFDMPENILSLAGRENIVATATLSASMTFNNGRRAGQAPVVTIIECDGDVISNASLTGGSTTSEALKASWSGKSVLGTFDTLNKDVSEEMDITAIVKEGKSKIGLYITCRSEDGYLSDGIVNFNSPILTIETTEITGDALLEGVTLPKVICDGYELPDNVSGVEIEWIGDGVTDGVITANDTTEERTLTAKATVDNSAAEKEFSVIVAGKSEAVLSVFTKSSSRAATDKSMHLALNGEELNFGRGVLYAEADMTKGSAGETKVLENPYMVKGKEKYVIIAEILNTDLTGNSLGLWETENLYEYTFLGYLPFEGSEAVIYFDGEKYSVSYTSGNRYIRESADLVTFTDAASADDAYGECNVIITKAEADKLYKKLGIIENTSVDEIRLSVNAGEKLSISDMPMMRANYSDGGSDTIPVKWSSEEFNKIDFNMRGIYTVTGEADLYEPSFPMISARPDPNIFYHEGYYYFIATNESGQNKLGIRMAETIEGLASAEEIQLNSGSTLWAPELHSINGEVYLLYAKGSGWNYMQCHMRKCEGELDNPDDWGEEIRVLQSDGEYLCTDGITLDMTCFEAGGKSYVMWAQRKIDYSGNGNHGASNLYIATVDPSVPCKLTSEAHLITEPLYGWDRNTSPIDEGPYAIFNDGKIYITYSGSGVDNTYAVGLLSADENADLLDVNSWKRGNYPILEASHVEGEMGPGHNSFVKNEYGKDIFVYHAKPNGGTRSAGVRYVYFDTDGEPMLYMTPDRYLKSEYRTVKATITVTAGDMTEDEMIANADAARLEIPNADNIKGNITLPETGEYGSRILWTSSDESIISTEDAENEGYDNTPAGVVVRGDEDKSVTLTATITSGTVTKEKVFDVTVKALSKEEDKVGYIYAYFRGSVNGEKEVQQIHLAVSTDGLNWKDLNGNFPVIESKMGTEGLRDPYIIRSPYGDKFYLMATDLDANGGQWTQYGEHGSKSLMFWESDDLVNWSEQRMVEVSDDTMGCTWAPEAIYDEITGEYLIYWSSHRADLGGKKVVQYSKTRDFVTFTKPDIFVGGDGVMSVIDTTMIKGDDGKFYRFTKYADKVRVFMEVADKPMGPYTMVDSNITDIYGVEGPAIFKMLDGRYCLMLDGYTGENSGVGFFPLVTDDLASGQFTRLTEGFTMPTGAKHGVIVAVTEAEYDAVMEKWGSAPDDDTVYEYRFENDGSDSEGVLHGNAKIENGVLTLDGTDGTYFSLPDGILDKRENYTVSMDVLSNMESGFFFTYAVGENTSDYQYLRIRGNHVRLAQTISGNSYEKQINYVPEIDFNDDWHNYIIVGEYDKLTLYIDGECVGSVEGAKTLYHLGENLPVVLGKSTFSGDLYFNGSYDNVKIYNRALTADEIAGLTTEESKLRFDADSLYFVNPAEITYDIDFITRGEKSGCDIQWTTSDESVISKDGKVTRGDVNKKVTVTATLTLGDKKIEKVFNLTVLGKEEDYAYLFAYFTGNSANEERLFYGASKDGYNFRALNNGNSVLISDLGTGCIRDPYIMKGEDGYYYIIATDMKSSLGWSSNYATVVYKTPDLINIVDKAWINYREFTTTKNCTRAWAPQAIWCPEKNAYMVYLAIATPDEDYGTVMYRHYATDLCDISTYTEPEFMLDQPAGTNAGAIDGDIVYDKFHDKYIMYYDGKRLAESDTISGQWVHVNTKYDDGQLPMNTAGGSAMAVEGSNIWQIIGEDKWVIAADGTSFNGGCYALVETEDFENYTQLWEDKGEYSFDFTPRHGYVIPISERELNNLFAKYGMVELPEEKEDVIYSLNISADKKDADIAPDMYGVFYEDINYSADGGLYSEVIENRSFEAAHCNPDKGEAYTPMPDNAWTVSDADALYKTSGGLNENNPTFINLDLNAGATLTNDCYGGFSVNEGERFDVSLYARGSYEGKITVEIFDGDTVLGKCILSGVTSEFTKLETTVGTKGTASSAKVRLTFDQEGVIDIDMISVMTQNTFMGRKNGLRRDLVEMLNELHPKFIRFPGGCVVEGYYLDNRYNWKESVGPVEARRENWNRWQTGSNGYDYCQSLGMGFYEYFLLCEDLGAKALPVVSCGIACQYQSGEASSWDDLYNVYIKDALDLIEFANGTPDENWEEMVPDITNPEKFNNNWANMRALMGHEESFELEYLGIGNEQWNTAENRFFERYEAFEEEIHKVYPEIKLISTSGPSADGDKFESAWEWLKGHNGEENFTYAVDEHYYRTPEWFLANINRYDSYDRDGFSVFAGEYAANGTYGNTLYSALSEAAYMTGLEKNADIVKMASYAPLLAKTGSNQWSPDLIWFNSESVYGTPDYYVQSMYSNNMGTYTVESKIAEGAHTYRAGVGTWQTSAQFKDIVITDNVTGEVINENLAGASNTGGTWSNDGSICTQTSTSYSGAFNMVRTNSDNYTIELKAMKTGGNEGFLIPFHYEDSDNYIFWNIAGWSNTQTAVQRVVDGSKSTVSESVTMNVSSNVWYDIKVEVKGDYAYLYFDGELIHTQFIALTKGPVYQTASVDEKTGDIIIKLVNTGGDSEKVDISLSGIDYIAPVADEFVLSGNSLGDKNSHDNPQNICEVQGKIENVSESFTYDLAPYSFVVLRVHTKEFYVEEIKTVECEIGDLPETVAVVMSDGSEEERSVVWKNAQNTLLYEGEYQVEGVVEGSNLYAVARLTVKNAECEFTGENKAKFTSRDKAEAVIAVYKDGILLEVSKKEFEGEIELGFNAPSGTTVKLMVWKGTKPLCEAVVKEY